MAQCSECRTTPCQCLDGVSRAKPELFAALPLIAEGREVYSAQRRLLFIASPEVSETLVSQIVAAANACRKGCI